MYVVAGVSGNVGSVVADALLKAGKKVRVIVRDEAKGAPWKARGAEVALADVSDAGALTSALKGADGAFLLVPPPIGFDDPLARQHQVIDAEVAAVRASGVKHVVLLSSVGAQHQDGTGPIKALHAAEAKLRETGVALTFIRAASFMENAANALGGLPHGIYATFNALDYPYPMVATHDIGTEAAKALLAGGKGVDIIELVGPQDYSERDVATALSALVGKELKVQQGPIESMVPTLVSYGFKPKLAELFREMVQGAAAGIISFDGKGRRVRGVTPIGEVLKGLLARAPKAH